jgi:hypothetical protein
MLSPQSHQGVTVGVRGVRLGVTVGVRGVRLGVTVGVRGVRLGVTVVGTGAGVVGRGAVVMIGGTVGVGWSGRNNTATTRTIRIVTVTPVAMARGTTRLLPLG